MSDDDAELVKRLRECPPGLLSVRKDCLEAAERIEALSALVRPEPVISTMTNRKFNPFV